MNVKQFEVLVALHPEEYPRKVEVKPLRYILDDPRRSEMDAIRHRFYSLWTLEVFVDPRKLDPTHRGDPRVMAFSGACESPDFFGLPNDLHPSLRHRSYNRFEAAANDFVTRWEAEHKGRRVPYSVFLELVQPRRDVTGSLRQYLYEILDGRMKSENS